MNIFAVTFVTAAMLLAIPIASRKRLRRLQELKMDKYNSDISTDGLIAPINKKAGKKADMMSYIHDMEKDSCIPEYKMLSIIDQLPGNDHSSFFPTCVKVKKCKGCCMGNRQCISLRKNIASHTIRKLGEKKTFLVTVSEDEECGCDCKFKGNCDFENAHYDEMKCSCGCRNTQEKFTCQMKSLTHKWREERCRCNCREVKKCSTSYDWNRDTCKCESKHSNIELFNNIYI